MAFLTAVSSPQPSSKSHLKILLTLLFIGLIGYWELYLETPQMPNSQGDNPFPIDAVMEHIHTMGSEVHFMGTQKNREVRDYIINYFESLGIETELFVGHSQLSFGGTYARFGRTENIIAKLKGTNPTKTLMLSAHYDSVLDAPGAADDVHGVACIMEVAKLLKETPRKNDIIFYISDGEEMGLLGAQAYVENKDLSNLGLVLNYEARGNAGSSIAFEWSEGNNALVEQVQKVSKNLLASSLSYEIYKVLPNNTDYTRFKEKGVPGINHAFIEGFSYYHNPIDNADNINVASVQHTGENMYLLAKHFANEDLSNLKTENATFFNFLGFLIAYPSKWDIGLLILVILLFGVYVYRQTKAETVRLKNYILSFLWILLGMGCCFLVSWGLSKLLFSIYPHYTVFYSGQYYNHTWYWGTMSGLCFVVLWFVISRGIEWLGKVPMLMAAISILLVLSIAIYFLASTAVYILLFPLLLVLGYQLLFGSDTAHWIWSYVFSIVPIVLLFPTYYLVYTAFSIKGLPATSFMFSIFGLCLFGLFANIFKKESIVTPLLGLLVFISTLIVAHIKSSPTVAEPLPSSLYYVLDTDTKKAFWASDDEYLNRGNAEYLQEATFGNIPLQGRRDKWHQSAESYTTTVSVPTIERDSQSITLRHQKEIFQTRIFITDIKNIATAKINNQVVIDNKEQASKEFTLDLFGITQDSLNIQIERFNPDEQQILYISSRFKELPVDDKLPNIVRRMDGYTSVVQKVTY